MTVLLPMPLVRGYVMFVQIYSAVTMQYQLRYRLYHQFVFFPRKKKTCKEGVTHWSEKMPLTNELSPSSLLFSMRY